MPRFLYPMLVIALVFSGCTSETPTQAPQPSPSAFNIQPASTLTPLPTSVPSPTPLPAWKNTQYEIKSKFSYAWRKVSNEETIIYTNNSTDTLSELVLSVEPNTNPGVMRLATLAWEDGEPVRGYALENNRLQIPLMVPLQPYKQIRLELAFNLTLPEIPPPADDRRPIPFGYTERQVNLVDWIPLVAPYRVGKGWLINKPWFYGEHQVYDLADFSIEMEIIDQPAGLLVAASTPPSDKGSIKNYTLLNARNFVLTASPYYQRFTRQIGDTLVESYAFTFDTTAGKAALEHTANALDLYNKQFGTYPRKRMTVVEADFLDGMEYDGLYFLSRGFYNLYNGTPQGYLAAIAAHETAHQWWYASVANNQALEPWLDEALCTYSEYIYYKNVHPDYLKWWWQFRVDYYEPQGKINLPLYDYTSYRGYRDAVYLNGAHFLDELRTLTGDEAFYKILKTYAASFAGQIATAEDFLKSVALVSSADLKPLLQKYFK